MSDLVQKRLTMVPFAFVIASEAKQSRAVYATSGLLRGIARDALRKLDAFDAAKDAA
ncbi:hypothetical protein [Sphingopyxis sp.]|uniref:hypothetical protein n=1 Tax=Sphingopyxis sp. TaxID=1908224 RepID=UPI00262838BB|nr:hypothetical protein [Sphingopyxis sp.]MCW0199022.1 hypothetical protein [Sphingopyxis sp.]